MKKLEEFLWGSFYGLLFGLACMSFAKAEDLPQTKLVEPLQPQTSVDAAAKLALTPLFEKTDGREWGGAILNCSGYFYATDPVSIGDARGLGFVVMAPDGCTLAGLYHSHPVAVQSGSLFSEADANTADRLNVPMFMASFFDSKIRKYAPRGERYGFYVGRRKIQMAQGEVI